MALSPCSAALQGPSRCSLVVGAARRPLGHSEALAASTAALSWAVEGLSDEGTLVKTRSRKVCITCHWFRHHAGVNCIPVLTCQLHQGLIAQCEHLISRSQGWSDDMVRTKGWAPEVA